MEDANERGKGENGVVYGEKEVHKQRRVEWKRAEQRRAGRYGLAGSRWDAAGHKAHLQEGHLDPPFSLKHLRELFRLFFLRLNRQLLLLKERGYGVLG